MAGFTVDLLERCAVKLASIEVILRKPSHELVGIDVRIISLGKRKDAHCTLAA